MIAVGDACNRMARPTILPMPRRIKILFVLLSTWLLATCGGGGSASTPVTPVNAAPVANAGLAQSVLTGTLVTLDGSASTDCRTYCDSAPNWPKVLECRSKEAHSFKSLTGTWKLMFDFFGHV